MYGATTGFSEMIMYDWEQLSYSLSYNLLYIRHHRLEVSRRLCQRRHKRRMISVGRSEGADVGQKWRREADRVAEVPVDHHIQGAA